MINALYYILFFDKLIFANNVLDSSYCLIIKTFNATVIIFANFL